eukprot:4519283-Alexandrium_andersonii.AAC.1
MLAAPKWLAANIEAVGVRPASVAAGARGAGLERFVATLGLTEKQAADVLGDALDRDCVVRR